MRVLGAIPTMDDYSSIRQPSAPSKRAPGAIHLARLARFGQEAHDAGARALFIVEPIKFGAPRAARNV